jgi:hypothetical protein
MCDGAVFRDEVVEQSGFGKYIKQIAQLPRNHGICCAPMQRGRAARVQPSHRPSREASRQTGGERGNARRTLAECSEPIVGKHST